MSTQPETLPVSTRRVPTTGPARAAWAIVIAALIVWSATHAGWVISSVPHWLLLVLRHGAEGAFVGGVCDAFAIWKVYVKVEDNFESMATEVSRVVVKDMVRPREIIEEIKARVNDPAIAREAFEALEKQLPTRESYRELIERRWERDMRPEIVEWLVEADATGWFGSDRKLSTSGLASTPIRRAVHECLKSATSDEELAGRLRSAIKSDYGDVLLGSAMGVDITVGRVLKLTTNASDFHDWITSMVGGLRLESSGPPTTETAAVLGEYAYKYARAWAAMPRADRQRAAASIVDLVAPVFLDEFAEILWSQREQLARVTNYSGSLLDVPYVRFLVTRMERALEDYVSTADDRIEGALAERLQSMGKHEFRYMLESNTRKQLDWVQVNGALLGLGLGSVAGLAGWLLH